MIAGSDCHDSFAAFAWLLPEHSSWLGSGIAGTVGQLMQWVTALGAHPVYPLKSLKVPFIQIIEKKGAMRFKESREID